jgi:predicted secreted Zn-dependent protease
MVSVRFRYYELRGRSAAELRRQMDESGPKEEGESYDARTHWSVRWRFRYESAGSSCRISSASTTVETEILLPRWLDAAQAPAELRARWSRYLQALRLHENGHARFGEQAAAEIEQAILEMPPRPSCPELERSANALAEELIEKYRRSEREYDASTRHGATQGARFP